MRCGVSERRGRKLIGIWRSLFFESQRLNFYRPQVISSLLGGSHYDRLVGIDLTKKSLITSSRSVWQKEAQAQKTKWKRASTNWSLADLLCHRFSLGSGGPQRWHPTSGSWEGVCEGSLFFLCGIRIELLLWNRITLSMIIKHLNFTIRNLLVQHLYWRV